MDIWHYKRPAAIRLEARTARAGILLAIFAGLAGCASPGPPLPPSLKLPEVIAAGALTATRVGDTVALHWTTPTHTTDKLLIAGPITAVLCRDLPAAKPDQPTSKAPPCTQVQHLTVTPGPSDAVDTLPAPLTTGPARRLAYRVELLNAAGRTAGPSAPVFAAAGASPAPVNEFHATPTKAGVVLEWKREGAALSADATDPNALQEALSTTIELTRTTLQAPVPTAAAAAQRKSPTGLPGTEKEPAVVHFARGNTDAGGTIDRTAQMGYTYSYTAQRVRSAGVVNNQTLELRSAPSVAVTVPVSNIFPPEVPASLVAVPAFFTPSDQRSPGTPGYAGEAAAQHPAIDLSWEPDVEPHVAGYRVYRRKDPSGDWQRLTADLVPTAAYRDTAVVAGQTYTYRVTAVSDAGNESAPSAEASETAPAQ